MRLLFRFILLLFSMLVLAPAQAQVYTGLNAITVRIEGSEFFYEYASDQLLVRLDRELNRIECVVNTASFVPANDASPQVIFQDVFFTQKYPQFWIIFDAPMEQINAGRELRENVVVRGKILFQGLQRNTEFPIVINAGRDFLSFTTEFDFRMQAFRATLPRGYRNLLTGRIYISIVNARWIESETLEPMFNR